MALKQISFAFEEEPVSKTAAAKAVAIQKPAPDKIKAKGDNKKLTRGRVRAFFENSDANGTTVLRKSLARLRA